MKSPSEQRVYEFNAKLRKHQNLDATFIEFPYDVEREFGTRGQVKVLARFDGVEYRGSLVKMGRRCHCMGVTQAIRRQIGKKAGDMVHVALRRDDRPRVVDVPPELREVLAAHPDLAAFFETLSYTHMKEYAQWIAEAKKDETRQRRLSKAVDMLRQRIKHP